jgi:integrase
MTGLDKFVILLLLCYGVRISEVLCIRRQDLKGNSRVLLRGIKRSNDRVLENVLFYGPAIDFLNCFDSIGTVYSRFYYYRLCVKKGIKFDNGFGKKTSVTHAGRHLYAESLSQEKVELSTISRSIGHKSETSTLSYVKQSNSEQQKSSAS